AARARVRSCAFEVRLPVGLDLLDQLGRKRHVVERPRLLLAVLQGPGEERARVLAALRILRGLVHEREHRCRDRPGLLARGVGDDQVEVAGAGPVGGGGGRLERVRARGNETDRKSTRLNSSHVKISYAVFCLKKKKKQQ